MGWNGPVARPVRRPAGRNGEGCSRADSHRSVFSPPALPVGESPTGTGGSPVPPIFHTGSECRAPACLQSRAVLRFALFVGNMPLFACVIGGEWLSISPYHIGMHVRSKSA